MSKDYLSANVNTDGVQDKKNLIEYPKITVIIYPLNYLKFHLPHA